MTTLQSNARIELVQLQDESLWRNHVAPRQRLPHRGLVHLGFRVSSITALEERLAATEMTLIRIGPHKDNDVLYGDATFFARAIGPSGEHLVFWSDVQ